MTQPRLDPRVRTTTPSPAPSLVSSESRAWVRVLAAAALVVLGMRYPLPQGVQLGFVVAVALLPVWWGAVRRRRWGVSFMAVGALAAVAGLWLGVANAVDHDVDRASAVPMTVLLVGALLGIGLFLWAGDVLGPQWATLFFGVGLALQLTPTTALFASNPWKFGFALPATVIILALAARLGRRWELAALLVLTVVAALNDFRSAFGLLLLAAILVFAQMAIVRPHRRPSAPAVLVGLAALGFAVFQLGQALILDGYLGQAAQSRSVEQLRVSGSLILGGRPELAATLALMRDHPWGFGAGAVPTPEDIRVAKEGMSSIGYQPNNGYVERFMFGGNFELHSVVGNLWSQSGVVGLALVAFMLVVLAVGMARRIADGTASGIMLYASAQSIWNVFFSPFYGALTTLILALGLAFLPLARRRTDDDPGPSSGVPEDVRAATTPRPRSSRPTTG